MLVSASPSPPHAQSASVPPSHPLPLHSAVENEDRLSGYATAPLPTTAPLTSSAGHSIPSAAIDLSPAHRNKLSAAAASGMV